MPGLSLIEPFGENLRVDLIKEGGIWVFVLEDNDLVGRSPACQASVERLLDFKAPPRIKARATGSVAFLGDDVLSAKNVAPTLFLNYHFGAPGDRVFVTTGDEVRALHFAP